jgi:RNA polymerase sigma factor FliA
VTAAATTAHASKTAKSTGTARSTATTRTIMSARDQEEMITAHLPLVGHLVRELLGRLPARVSRDDLVSAGMIALVTAAKSFDDGYGVPFGRFASSRIRGALLDELRSLDWASRSVRSRARQLDNAQQQLTAGLGRTPTRAEIAAATGTTVAEVDAVRDDVQRAAVLSLQGFALGVPEDLVVESSAGPEDHLLYEERLGYLGAAVKTLPERLRTVVECYFLKERPMAEIAVELGVSESRVSQLRAEALTLLRDGLNSHLDPELVAPQARPEGCVARRREAYYAEIAAAVQPQLPAPATAGRPHAAA